jgi:hypothetical protein
VYEGGPVGVPARRGQEEVSLQFTKAPLQLSTAWLLVIQHSTEASWFVCGRVNMAHPANTNGGGARVWGAGRAHTDSFRGQIRVP